jgi:thioredoxin 1
MNKYFILIAAVIVVLLIVGAVFSSLNSNKTTDNSSSIKWNTDINQAMQQAKATNKSIFIDFYADWCPYCKEMDEGTYTDPLVKAKLVENYVLLKVNVDENSALSSKYQAYSLPTMVIIDSNGNKLKSIIGYQSPEDLISQI